MGRPTKPRVALITRIADKNDLFGLQNLLRAAKASGISEKDTYAILRVDDGENTDYLKNVQINLVHDNDPTGPISMNMALHELQKDPCDKPDAFLVISKEVTVESEDIMRLVDTLWADSNMLVVGYRFKIKDKNLNDELQSYYHNKNLLAFNVPWNTCAAWNYKLFNKYVEEFDEIATARSPFPAVDVVIGGTRYQTPHKGMEDGLAIAKAISKNKNLHFRLLDEYISWDADGEGHREKLARKDLVMRDHMALRDYPAEVFKDARP